MYKMYVIVVFYKYDGQRIKMPLTTLLRVEYARENTSLYDDNKAKNDFLSERFFNEVLFFVFRYLQTFGQHKNAEQPNAAVGFSYMRHIGLERRQSELDGQHKHDTRFAHKR